MESAFTFQKMTEVIFSILLILGAMFRSDSSTERAAFEFAVEQINRDTSILRDVTLVPVVSNVNDVFSSSKKGGFMLY